MLFSTLNFLNQSKLFIIEETHDVQMKTVGSNQLGAW